MSTSTELFILDQYAMMHILFLSQNTTEQESVKSLYAAHDDSYHHLLYSAMIMIIYYVCIQMTMIYL